MEYVKVCRICLMVNVKMYDLHTHPLETCFVNLTGIELQNTAELPPYACYQCAALLMKIYKFKELCYIGHNTLYDIFNTTGKITENAIFGVDRRSLQLSQFTIEGSRKPDIFHICIYNEDTQFMKPQNIKVESKVEHKSSFQTEEDVFVKAEVYENLPTLSSDDELLSLHKTNKEKKVKKKEKKKVKKVRPKILDDDDDDDEIYKELEEVLPSADLTESQIEMLETALDPSIKWRKSKTPVVPPPKPAPKPRRTRHTGKVSQNLIELEEYVTIITLSMEEQQQEIINRQHSANYKNALFQCKLCYKGFIDSAAWDHHVAKHDPSAGDIECPICKFRFKSKRMLQKHASNHEKKYSCKVCPYVSKTPTQAKQHQKWHQGVTYKCRHCDEISTKWTSYLSHVRIKHPSEFICDICGYSFVSKLGLTMHKTMMHKNFTPPQAQTDGDVEIEPGPYCQECDLKFISEEAWKRHMVTSIKHLEASNFKNGCRQCGEVFSNTEELRIHHRKEHAKKRPVNYGKKPNIMNWPTKCEHCPEEIANARDYWAHFRRMHPDKRYPIQKNHVCDICGKSFRGNAFLMYHKRTHSSEKQFSCGSCGKAFYNRTNLHMHEKTHSDLRPYPCSVCFKAFKCKGALDRHFRCHTGVKPYICEVCGKGFGQSNSRKLHVRTVHLKQPAPYVSQARLERRARTREHSLPPF